MYDPYAGFVSTTLNSGLRVYVLHVPDLPFVYAQILFRSGMVDDPAEKAGVAHFLEHMVCANSGMTLTEMTEFLGEDGGGIVASTNYHRTRYGFKSLVDSGRFGAYLNFWAKATLENPLHDYFSREQDIIRSEISRAAQSEKLLKHNQTMHRFFFRGLSEGYAPSALGTRESFDNITLDDLVCQRQRLYVPQNAYLVCVGGMTLERVVEELNHTAFADAREGDVLTPFQVLNDIPPVQEHLYEADLTQGEQMNVSTLRRGWMFPGTIAHELTGVAWEMLEKHLTDELREKRGLVYSTGVGGEDMPSFSVGGLIANSFPSEQLEEVTKLVDEAVEVFGDDANLFAQVKQRLLAQMISSDQNFNRIANVASALLIKENRVVSRQERLHALRAIEFEHLAELRPFLTPDNALTVIEHK